MNEDLKKSLYLNTPMLILGIGTIAPLYACGTLRTNMLLGVLATITLIISTAVMALWRSGTPANGRIGAAVLVTGGLLTIEKIVLSAVPPMAALPVETLAPLMLVVAVLAAVTDAYDVKRKLSPAIFDGVAIGLSFLLLLCTAGLLRDFIGRNSFNGLMVVRGFQPLRMFVLVPGILLIAAFVMVLRPAKKRGAA
jgi:Na+-translocating ferredoxin:NAD+ oxidoreductase RnfE subunit